MSYNSGVEVLLDNGLNNQKKRAGLITATSTGALVLPVSSVSFCNSGAAAINLTVSGSTSSIPAGVTISFDGGGSENRFAGNTFSYDATGSTLLIAYTY
jgi:hypothetical protein